MIDLTASRLQRPVHSATRQRALIDYLRAMLLNPPCQVERIHAIFLDNMRSCVGDAPLGCGRTGSLTLRMREVFGKALALDASGILIAHNHPSGECRPSQFDIDATRRLNMVAKTLDIELLDHLIFTQDDVYSMRAGGEL